MERKAGILPTEPGVATPEINKLSPFEIQQLISNVHPDSIRGPKTAFSESNLPFFEQYLERPEVSEAIELITKENKKTTNKRTDNNPTKEEVKKYFITGLNAEIAVAKKIPRISNYEREEIAEAFIIYFSLFAQSISRIPVQSKPSKIAIKQLIEFPNYFEPNFYESLIIQIKHDSYYKSTNIFRALSTSPKNAKDTLEKNSQTFEYIKSILAVENPIGKIKCTAVRKLVERKGEEATDIFRKNLSKYYLKSNRKENIVQPNKEKIITREKISKLQTEVLQLKTTTKCLERERRSLEQKKKSLEIQNRALEKEKRSLEQKNQKLSQALTAKTASLETKQQELRATIESLRKRLKSLTQRNQRLSGTTSIRTTTPDNKKSPIQPTRTSNFRVNLGPQAQTEKTQKEKEEELLTLKLLPTPPIDYESSKDLTEEEEQQKKIDGIKDNKKGDSFAEEGVIKYYVIHYPDNTEERLKEDKIKMSRWKTAISLNRNISGDFKDDWILKHFIVYYPDDYESRYLEAEKAFSDLKSNTKGNKGFATVDILKKIVLHYYENRVKALEKGRLLYDKINEEFSDSNNFVNSNSSVINGYIIRNFDNPEEDLRIASEQFGLLLKDAINNNSDFFHSDGNNEISSERYLRLLFQYYPTYSVSTVAKIENVYQTLDIGLKDDDFFGDYKKFVLKMIAITSTEKPVLGYEKQKYKFTRLIELYKKYNIDRNSVLRQYLLFPNFASTTLDQRIPFVYREEFQKELAEI